MVNLGLEQLTFRLATGLAERFPTEQFLPAELNDALIALINTIGEAALRLAIRNTEVQLNEGFAAEEVAWTQELETSDRFATDDFPRDEIVLLIQDMSGLEPNFADLALGIVEGAVDEPVFGLRNKVPESVRFEGIGVINAGTGERSYHIILDESLCIPPLRNISALSRYEKADNESIAR